MELEKATSLRRAIELLLALGSDESLSAGGLGVTRLAELLGEDKSRVSRTLRTLQEYALVERDPQSRAFRVGWRVHTLAARAGEARLLAAGPAVLAGLVARLGESAHLSVRSGDQVLTVLSHASLRPLTAVGWVGREIPAHCTSSGRALLLDHDLAALRRVFGGADALAPAGPRAPRTVEELHARIVAARREGFATAVEESEPGLVAAAAAVRDGRGQIVAAVNVSAPAFRFAGRLEEAGVELTAAAAQLSRAVGWIAPGAPEPPSPAVDGGRQALIYDRPRWP